MAAALTDQQDVIKTIELVPAEVVSDYGDDDDRILAEMGYKQELRRGFNGIMSFSFCYTAVSVLSGVSILYTYGLETGGPAVMVWGWIVTSIMTLIIGAVMGEICSTYPSAGSVYHWAGMMAPPKYAALSAYVDGWFNFFGNAGGDAAFAYGFAEVLSAAIEIGGGEGFSVGERVGISLAVMVAWGLLNALRADEQGWINNFSALWQVATTIAIVVCVLVYPSEQNTNEFVWFSTNNATGFSDSHFGYVVLMGLLMSTFSFSGYEGGAHMAEETRNASKSAPWGIVMTCIMVAVTGLIYILGLLYATPDMNAAIEGANGVIVAYVAACGPAVGRILANLLLSNIFLGGMSSTTVTSRIGYAMARDNAFPGSQWLRVVHPKLQIPLRTVVLVMAVNIALLLLPLVTPLAFNAITGTATIGYQISYMIPIIQRAMTGEKDFQRSAFHLGTFSRPMAWIAAAWLLFTSILLLLPSCAPITAENFNWTPVVILGLGVVATVYWVMYARYHFTGPCHKKKNPLDETASTDLTLPSYTDDAAALAKPSQ